MKYRRLYARATAFVVIFALCANLFPALAFSPQTAYGQEFVALCDGQEWFLDEVERHLNARQKSVNTIMSRADLAEIVALGFAEQDIDGVIPRAIGELTELRSLFLSGNGFSNFPVELFTLHKLETLDLSANNYTGELPAQLGTMPQLRILRLADNGFTGGVPASVLNNTKLEVLDLSGNALSGGLPAGLGGMTGLTYLGVAENPWGGAVPDLSALTNLAVLSAWNCGLTGTIPDSIYGLAGLQILDLAGNRLTGTISAAIGNLTQLQLLALGENELTGELPAELAALTQLMKLDLSDNALEALIPDIFGNMTQLTEVHIENNRLRGVLPASLDTDATDVYAQNNYLTGSHLLTATDYVQNFGDGAANEQYRLTGPERVVLTQNAEAEVFGQLRNRSLRTGSTFTKPMLEAGCYQARIVGDPRGKVLLRADVTGIYVSIALPPPGEEPFTLPAAENIRLEIWIDGNAGSAYSTVSILLTTDVPPSPPPSGGSTPSPGGGSSQAHKSYVDGYPDGRFGPEDALTREQAAKLIVVAVGLEPPAVQGSRFPDIQPERWSAGHISAAYRQGWLIGLPDGTFGPEAIMSRGEFAAFLTRVWGTNAYDENVARDFDDVPQDAWYYEYVRKASALGLMGGKGDGLFHPGDPISRAEAVTVINRLLGRNPETAPALKTAPMPFSDVPDGHWAQMHILEAATEHAHPQGGQ